VHQQPVQSLDDELDPAFAVGISAAPDVNPVHNVLILCGVSSIAPRQIFIDLEGLAGYSFGIRKFERQ
jgi:hypothetical protein